MQNDCYFATVDERDLDQLLAGHEIASGQHFSTGGYRPSVHSGHVGVLWRMVGDSNDVVYPLVLVAHESDLRRLCGRYAQIRSDLAPLTSWCHLFTPERFKSLEDVTRKASLGGMQAAWTGLTVAEALLLSELPIANLKVSACFATQTFATARAVALWGNIDLHDLLSRHDAATKLFRAETRNEARFDRISTALSPIWMVLSAMSRAGGSMRSAPGQLTAILSSLEALRLCRKQQQEGGEVRAVLSPLTSIMPVSGELLCLEDASAEKRVQFFDSVVSALDSSSDNDPWTRVAMALVAGYIVTVAAGGSASLTLADSVAKKWPEITAWAYVIGGIGENITWTSAFDGLGRLVSREMMRSARFDDPPPCDFAIDEAVIIADRSLSDSLVHLRIKQARVASVALLPGVYSSVAISEQSTGTARTTTHQPEADRTPGRDVFAALADALWPYLRNRLQSHSASQESRSDSQTRNRSGKRQGQTQLPLNDPKRRL